MVDEDSVQSVLENVQRVQTYWDDAVKNADIHNTTLSRRQEELMTALRKYSLSAGPEGSALRVQLHNFSHTDSNGQTQQDITKMLESVNNPKREYLFTGGIIICSANDLGMFSFSDRTYTPLIQCNTSGSRMRKAFTERDVDGELSSLVIHGNYSTKGNPSLYTSGIVRITRDGKQEIKNIDSDINSGIIGFFRYQNNEYVYTRKNAMFLEEIMNGSSERVPFRFDSTISNLVSRPKVLSLGSTPSGDSLYALTESDGSMVLQSVVLKDGKFRFINDGFLYDEVYAGINIKSARIVPDERGTMLVIEGPSEGPVVVPSSDVKRRRINDKEEDGNFPRRKNIQELVTVLGNVSAVAHIDYTQNIYVYRIDTKSPERIDVLPIPENVRASSTLTTVTQQQVEILKKMKSEGLLPSDAFF